MLKKTAVLFFFFSLLAPPLRADAPPSFADGEATFKLVLGKLLDKHLDSRLTRDELYRAATAGMLESLNSGKESWNKLYTPEELRQLKADLSGKVSGIGAAIRFDERTGHGIVLSVIAGSPAEKAGVRRNDEILSVDGKSFRDKSLKEMVYALRGKPGESVQLKLLREDRIQNLKLKRAELAWTPIEYEKLEGGTGLLSLGFLPDNSAAQVEAKVEEINRDGLHRLILDLRDNAGGNFENAIRTAELFVPKGAVIASTRDRAGKTETYASKRGLLNPDLPLVVLVNKGTASGAELLLAALRETRKARVIGTPTFGKWNAQELESLPNGFGLKYTVREFLSPSGKSFQGTGLKPDLEIPLPESEEVRTLRSEPDFQKRLERDPQLKAALAMAAGL
jgi:carboxyl-terminal processing protease